MDINEIMELLDNAVYEKTGKGLSELQRKILEGTFNSETYAQIAASYGCEERTASDAGYELFQNLSKILEKKVGKNSFKEFMDKQKGSLNIFLGQVNNIENNNMENIIGSNVQSSSSSRHTIKKLKRKYGMSDEDIADVLDIPLEDIQKINLDE
jgi:hypothetical protein